MTGDAPLSRRARYRQQTCEDIKQAAREQIAAAGGAAGLSLNALARQLGMAGPSLYRYFASRDDLITALIADAYTDLADHLVAAVAGDLPPGQRLRRHGAAYRGWAQANPALYDLLFGAPVPGYAAPDEVTGPAARQAMAVIVEVLHDLRPAGPPPAAEVRPLPEWRTAVGLPHVDDATLVLAIQAWSRLHGLVSLEIDGHFRFMVDDPAALYEAEYRRLTGEATG